MQAAMPAPVATGEKISVAAAVIDSKVDAKVDAKVAVPAPTAAPSAEPATAMVRASIAPIANPSTYSVQQGDTLFAIAKRFNLSIEQLKALNNMNGNQLQLGQNLLLGGMPGNGSGNDIATLPSDGNLKPAVVKPRNNTAAPRVTSTPAPAAKTYTVRAGDSLFAIAQKTGVSLENLLRWNKLTAKSVIQPGARLRVS